VVDRYGFFVVVVVFVFFLGGGCFWCLIVRGKINFQTSADLKSVINVNNVICFQFPVLATIFELMFCFCFLQDIAVMTNDVSRCEFYRNESQNVKDRWACIVPIPTLEKFGNKILPNNKEDCEVSNDQDAYI